MEDISTIIRSYFIDCAFSIFQGKDLETHVYMGFENHHQKQTETMANDTVPISSPDVVVTSNWRHCSLAGEQFSFSVDSSMNKCDKCSASFKSKNNLKRHQLVHSDLRRFKCNECNFAFKLNSHLKEHMVVHTGIRPYVCQICDTKFARRQELEGHMLIHTGEKPFSCGLCGVAFRKKCGLIQHNNGNVPKFRCTICKKISGRRSCMEKHVQMNHPSKSQDNYQSVTNPLFINSKTPTKDEIAVTKTETITNIELIVWVW